MLGCSLVSFSEYFSLSFIAFISFVDLYTPCALTVGYTTLRRLKLCVMMPYNTARRVGRVRRFRRIKNFLLGPVFVPVFVLFFLIVSVLTMQAGLQPTLPQGALFNFLEFRPNPRFDRAPWKINLDFTDLERRRRVFLREQALKERQAAKFRKDVIVSVAFCSLAILSITLCILRSDPRWDWPRGNDE